MKNNKKMKVLLFAVFLVVVIGSAMICICASRRNYTSPDEIPLRDDVFVDEYPDDGDADGDGLSNAEEKRIGTSLIKKDTDSDGLGDSPEVGTYGTDPLNPDTDGDGLKDGHEAAFALDPLQKKTDGKTPDGKVKFNMELTAGTGTLSVEGSASIADAYFAVMEQLNISKTPGVTGDVYEFYMEKNGFSNAVLTLPIDEKSLKKAGGNKEHIAAYELLNDGTFQKLEYTMDNTGNSLTVSLMDSAKVVLGDSRIMDNDITSRVFILLDNSGSMFSCFCQKPDCNGESDICKKADGNDVYFKRVDMAKELIEKCGDDIVFGLGKFTKTYTQLSDGFSSSETELTNALEDIRTQEENFNGTYIANSIKEALENFDENDNSSRKFILLLTDGETTEWLSLYDENDAIEEANRKNVSVIIIGLGSDVDADYLTKISDATGGMYVYATNSSALEQVYDTITAGLNYGMTDLDNDGMNDSILIADSGFDIDRDTFCFNNYIFDPNYGENVHFGQCYGIAAVTQLYYRGKLPLKGKEIEPFAYGTFKKLNLQCDAYDITDVDFFKRNGKYADNKEGLRGYLFLESYIAAQGVSEKYVRDSENTEHLAFTDEVKDIVDSSELLSIIKYSHDTYIWDGDGKKYTSHDRICLDLDADKETLSEEDRNAYEVLTMIHHYYVSQGLGVTDEYSIYMSDPFSDEYGSKQDEAFDLLVSDLKSGIIPVLGGHGHAVNAVSLYRDIDNPCHYTLYIYDNNSRRELKRIEIVKEKTGFSISASDWNNGGYDYILYDTDNTFKDGDSPEVSLKCEVFR